MYRLTGARRSYDWGSTTSMFDFLGLDADGEPFAELWLGAHPTGPSDVQAANGPAPLDQVIAAEPVRHLGQRVQEEFGRLPYLLKLLAPARPLSLQVHPHPAMAQAGYKDEQNRGVPISDPKRSFKDQHHKPEMVYALTRFEGLVGFRAHIEAAQLLKSLGGPLEPACQALAAGQADAALQHLLELTESDVEWVVEACREKAGSTADPAVHTAYATVGELAGFYPGDAGAVISLLLNRVVLEPGQLVFLASGVPHAYLSGFGLELMANSDNVLRLGMTSKHIDVEAMFEAVDFATSGYKLESAPGGATTHVFSPPVPEFALSVSRIGQDQDAGTAAVDLPGDGPRILICLGGSIRVTTPAGTSQERVLEQGQAVFASAADGLLRATGSGILAQAFVP